MKRRIAAEAADWALRLAEQPSEGERRRFDAWRAASAAHAEAFERVQRIMGDAGRALRQDADFSRGLLGRSQKRSWPAAMVAFLLVATSAGAFLAADGPLRLQADFISAAAEMPRIALSDGSRVTLNGESAIAVHFDAGTRRVTLLQGEAYFEVARDPARPFIVEAGPGRIAAKGTAFDVNRVAGAVDVTVTEHAVSVETEGDAPMLVPAGRRLSYDAQGVSRPPQSVPQGFETPWRSGRLVFEDRPLSMVVEEIFRYLPGKVMVADAGVAARRISGSFDLSDPDAALASFGTVFGLKIVRLGPALTLIY